MAVENRPDQADAYAVLGAALIRTERFVEAEEILRRALEIDPGHKNTRRYIAGCYGCKLTTRKRSRPTARCSRSTPEYAQAHAYIGDVLLHLHRYAEAVKPLNKALILIKAAPSLTPDLPTAGLLHALLGKASWGLGRLEAGDEYFRRALELDPHNMVTIEYVAAAHFRQKRYQEALDLYRTLLEIDPDRAATHADIGATLHFLGRSEEAIRSLERALSLDPTLETARTNLERCARGCGNRGSSGFSTKRVIHEGDPRIHEGIREGVKRFIHEKAKTYPRRATKKGKGPLRGWRRIQRGAPRVGKGEEDIHEGGIGGKSYPRRNTKGSAKGLEENPEGSAMGRE